MAIELDRDARYAEALRQVGTDGRVLRALEARHVEVSQDMLERDLLAALARADELGTEGAVLPLAALFAGPTLNELVEAEAYAVARHLDAEPMARIERLERSLCAALSPGSKYRGLCH